MSRKENWIMNFLRGRTDKWYINITSAGTGFVLDYLT